MKNLKIKVKYGGIYQPKTNKYEYYCTVTGELIYADDEKIIIRPEIEIYNDFVIKRSSIHEIAIVGGVQREN